MFSLTPKSNIQATFLLIISIRPKSSTSSNKNTNYITIKQKGRIQNAVHWSGVSINISAQQVTSTQIGHKILGLLTFTASFTILIEHRSQWHQNLTGTSLQQSYSQIIQLLHTIFLKAILRLKPNLGNWLQTLGKSRHWKYHRKP